MIHKYIILYSLIIFNIIIAINSVAIPDKYNPQNNLQFSGFNTVENWLYSSDQRFLVIIPKNSPGQLYVYNGRRNIFLNKIIISDGTNTITPFCLAFSKQTDVLVIGTKQGLVYGHQIANNQINPFSFDQYDIRTTPKENFIRSVSISVDGMISVGGQDKVVLLKVNKDTIKFNYVDTLDFPYIDIYSVAWSSNPTDNLLIGGISQNNGVFSLYSLSQKKTQTINTEKTNAVAYFPDGDFFLQASIEKSITIFDAKDNSAVKTIDNTVYANKVAVSQNGQLIAAEVDGKNVYVFKVTFSQENNLRNGLQAVTVGTFFTQAAQKIAFSSTGNQILVFTTSSTSVSRLSLCQDGNYFNQQTNDCGACTGNCENCFGAGDLCESCKPNTFFDSEKCISCGQKVKGCTDCSTDGTACVNCNQGQKWKKAPENGVCVCQSEYYEKNKVCVTCTNIPNCLTCNSETSCVTCNGQNYQPNAKNGKCICQSAFFEKNNKCISCTAIPNCVTCESETSCLTCSGQKYQPIAKGGKCVCKSEFYEKDNTCVTCTTIPNCVTCESETSCLTCNGEHYKPNAQNGKCICQPEFYEKDNKCISCSSIPNCLTCNSETSCVTCNGQNYQPNAKNGKCICQSAFFEKNNKCISCTAIPNCVTCESETSCLTCSGQKYQPIAKGGKCVCKSEFYEKDNTCVTCTTIPNCVTCDSQTRCLTCKGDNFQPIANDGVCVCKAGFTLVDGICQACGDLIPGCQLCEQETICEQCDPKKDFIQTPDENGTCICKTTFYLNDKKCELCSTKITQCTQCTADGSLCTKCNGQANRQLSPDNTTCICADFYYENQNVCAQCDRFEKCINCNDTQSCNVCNEKGNWIKNQNDQCVCKPGYYELNNACKLCDVVGCALCEGPQQQCEICQTDKGFIQQPQNGTCTCEMGRFLNKDQCSYCSSVMPGCQLCQQEDKCQFCDKANNFIEDKTNNQCACKNGHYLNDKKDKCLSCSANNIGCKQCDEEKKCKKCNTAEHFAEDPNKDGSCGCVDTYYKDRLTRTCTLCSSSIQNCIKCQQNVLSAVQCEVCANDFVLNEDKTKCEQDSGLSPLVVIAIIVGILALAGGVVAIIKCCKKRNSPLEDDEYEALQER